jgi:hypothetical protein
VDKDNPRASTGSVAVAEAEQRRRSDGEKTARAGLKHTVVMAAVTDQIQVIEDDLPAPSPREKGVSMLLVVAVVLLLLVLLGVIGLVAAFMMNT